MRTQARQDIQGTRSLVGACTFRGSSFPFSMNANVKLTTSTKRCRLSYGTTSCVSSMSPRNVEVQISLSCNTLKTWENDLANDSKNNEIFASSSSYLMNLLNAEAGKVET